MASREDSCAPRRALGADTAEPADTAAPTAEQPARMLEFTGPYRLADNKTAEAAVWDPDLLPLELKDLQGDRFDLSLTGFRAADLADLLGDFDTEVEPPPAGPDGAGDTVVCPKCGHEFAPEEV